jgi:hypothetical protein
MPQRVLNPYIDREKRGPEQHGIVGIVVQRLYGLLEVKTLKGIKKQISICSR